MRLSELPEIDETLRPYQVTGKKEIYRAWDTCRTVLFQMPTGTGKTRLFSSIIKDIRRLWQEDKVVRRVLVLAHRTELIQQIDETLSFKYGISHGIIKSGVEETWNRTVQVASVQTIIRRLDKWTAKDFAYIIIDEAHHAVSSTYMKICKQFPEAKILGVTATPCRLSGDALRKLFGVLVVSQPINKFIEQHYLSAYSYYSIKPESHVQRDLDSISHFNIEGDYAEADMMRVIDNNKVRANIVEAYQKHAQGKKGIIYTINQEHNKHICEAFEKIGVKIKAIDSKTPAEERKNTVAQFRSGKIDIICNVNIFSEGFDCPDIEFIQLARPTCSLAMYLQQVGRGLRPHPKGIPATILDNVGSYNKFGLPSANRQWRRHFEGQGQRVTKSSIATGLGSREKRKIDEGDEEMVLIFSGTSPVVEQSNDYEILNSIRDTKEWFPFGSTVLLDPYSGMINVRKITKAGCLYYEYEDMQEWLDMVEEEIESARNDIDNENKQDEIDWVDEKIHRIYRFSHDGKFGLCQFNESPKQIDESIVQCEAGKKRVEDIITLLLPPVYDEIGIPDGQGRAICVKDDKHGVLSSESYLPIVSFQYDALEFQPNGLYLALKNNRVGLIKGDEPVIPFEYEEIVDLSADIDKQYYFLSEVDHYRLVLYKGDHQATQQPKLPIRKRLFGALYLGQSSLNHGLICNSEGKILYPLYFDRIGVTLADNGVAFILGIRNIAFKLNQDLSELSEAIPCEESHDGFFDQFHLQRLFVANGRNINELAKNEDKKGVSLSEAQETEGEKEEQVSIKGNLTANIAESHEPEDALLATVDEEIHPESPLPPKATLPPGVFENEDGKQGYAIEGQIIVDAVYELIKPYGKDRLIVRKDGKDGVLTIDGKNVSELVPCVFYGLSPAKKHKYSVKMGGGYTEAHNEDFLKTVLFQTGQHFVVRTKDNRIGILFHSRQIGVYDDVTHVGKDIFIARNEENKYGLLRAGTVRADIIKPFEYVKIELSEDKRNVLLSKTGRPRFIPLQNLFNQ